MTYAEIGEKYREVLVKNPLFQGIGADGLEEALSCMRARVRQYRKGEYLFRIGDPVSFAGLILEGNAAVGFFDEDFNEVSVNIFTAGHVFGETMACLTGMESPVQVMAQTGLSILALDFNGILDHAGREGGIPATIAVNLVRGFARQNVILNQKVRILGQKKIRARLKVFLREKKMDEDGVIRLILNRTELARFLGVDRTALARELGHLQDEGILRCDGREIRILDRSFFLS